MNDSFEIDLTKRGGADLEVLFEVYHDALLLTIWKIFPDWSIAEEILRDVFNRLRKADRSLPCDEEQLYCMLVKICKKATLENIPFLSNNSH